MKSAVTVSRMSALALSVALAVSAGAALAATSSSTETVKGRAPTIGAATVTHNDVNANGVIDVGDTLTATDTAFNDLDGDEAIASTYRWTVDGLNQPENCAEYMVKAGDLGKPIHVYTTPHTDPGITDPADGEEESAGSIAIQVEAGTTLLSVAISGMVGGFPQVGTALIATPVCVETCDSVTYQWQIENAVGSGTYVDIVGATSSSYTPLKGDQKRKILVTAN